MEQVESPEESQRRVFRFGAFCTGLMIQVVVGTLIGYWLDQRSGTIVFTLFGLGLGMVLATISLIRFAQKWTPKAKRSAKEIPEENWNHEPFATDSPERETSG